MFFLAAIIALSFFFKSWASFLRLFLKILFLLSERRINFPIYLVGMSFRLSLKIIRFIYAFILLGPSFKIVVEARCYCDQVRLSLRKFLYSYSIFDSLGQAFIKLCYFSSFVLGYSKPILCKFN
jgi:hypothetical protein